MLKTVPVAQVECLVACGDQLGETPLWCDKSRKLWWVDIERPKLQCFDLATARHETNSFDCTYLGSQALTKDGTQLLALDLGLHRRHPLTGKNSLFCDVETGLDNRLNDGRVDAQGRLWIGTMDNGLSAPNGSLYRIDPDGTSHKMLDDIIVSNGIAFSPDSTRLYFTDTRRYCTWQFDFDCDEGTISNRQIFADYSETKDRPDGATTDVDGCLWTAFFGGSRIARYQPNGTIDCVIEMPVTNPTCVCFGGDDLKTLFVTSAAKFLTPEQRAAEPLAGALFAIHGMGQGLPEHRFG